MINSLIDLLDSLQSEEDCREFLETIRWDGAVLRYVRIVAVCPENIIS